MQRARYGQFRHAGAVLAGASLLVASPALAFASTRVELSVSATVVRPCTFSSTAVRPSGPADCDSPAFALSSANAESVRSDTTSGNIVYATFTY